MALLSTLGCATGSGATARPPATAVLAGRVVRVIDGDTLLVSLDTGPLRVRLYAVDAPEKQQPYGKQAAAALAALTAGKPISIEPIEQDRYQRLVGVVYLGDSNVNSLLVRQGHAWAYRRYMRKADAKLCSLEDRARRAKLGLWAPASGGKIVAPWDWRAKTRNHVNVGDYQGETVEQCIAAIGRRKR